MVLGMGVLRREAESYPLSGWDARAVGQEGMALALLPSCARRPRKALLANSLAVHALASK
jgi:hypothetical protein